MRYLPENNLSYPVLLEIANGSGSGFYLNFKNTNVYLVSAYHVLFDPETKKIRDGFLKLTSYDVENLSKEIVLNVDLASAKIISDFNKDTAMILMADYSETYKLVWRSWVRQEKGQGEAKIITVNFSALKKFDKALESNEVFVLGYPSSLGLSGQIDKKRPLLRKGIVAGKNYLNKTIILDCPVYFGNSGGLAIEVEKISSSETTYLIIGIVTQYIPFVEHLSSIEMKYVNTNMENSGYAVVIPADAIEEIINENNKNTDQ